MYRQEHAGKAGRTEIAKDLQGKDTWRAPELKDPEKHHL